MEGLRFPYRTLRPVALTGGVRAGPAPGYHGRVPGTLIIVGESTRAAARSAVEAGYTPWCVDLRGDRDLREIAGATRTLAPDAFPAALLARLEDAPRNAPVLLTAPMENHPDVVRAIAFQRPLLGGSADAIVASRSPEAIPSLQPLPGIRYPRSGSRLSLSRRIGQMLLGGFVKGAKHLLKPRLSSHGAGIEWYAPGRRVDDAHYVQQYVRGEPHTAVFSADGWSAFLLGVTEKIVGDPAFGATSPFQTLGDLGPVKLSEETRASLSRLAVQISQKYDVRGVFGVDLIMDHGGRLWPIEINPRYPSATEVLERAEGVVALLGTGASARAGKGSRGLTMGRVSVLATSDVTVGDLYEPLPAAQVCDVPPVGARIAKGRPICSVLASAPGREAVLRQLRERAGKVYAAVAAT